MSNLVLPCGKWRKWWHKSTFLVFFVFPSEFLFLGSSCLRASGDAYIFHIFFPWVDSWGSRTFKRYPLDLKFFCCLWHYNPGISFGNFWYSRTYSYVPPLLLWLDSPQNFLCFWLFLYLRPFVLFGLRISNGISSSGISSSVLSRMCGHRSIWVLDHAFGSRDCIRLHIVVFSNSCQNLSVVTGQLEDCKGHLTSPIRAFLYSKGTVLLAFSTDERVQVTFHAYCWGMYVQFVWCPRPLIYLSPLFALNAPFSHVHLPQVTHFFLR